MTETQNLQLKKFERTDNFDYQVLNENWDSVSEVASNPNLLDNTDFSNPVNQRGGASYSETLGSYTIDRWASSISGVQFDSNSHIRILSNSGKSNGYFVQRFENYKSLPNKTITVTAKYRTNNPKAYLTSFYHDGVNGKAYYGHKMIADSEWHIGSFTCTIPNLTWGTSGVPRVEFSIYPWHEPSSMNDWVDYNAITAESTTYIDLAWIKAEFGDKPTVWQKPNYQTELLKCQRYCVVAGVYVHTNSSGGTSVLFPTHMRTIPSLTIVEGHRVHAVNGHGFILATTVNSGAFGVNYTASADL